jgi:hypothetical protein
MDRRALVFGVEGNVIRTKNWPTIYMYADVVVVISCLLNRRASSLGFEGNVVTTMNQPTIGTVPDAVIDRLSYDPACFSIRS